MGTASDDRLTFLTAVAVHAEIEDLIPQFKRRHRIEVDVNYDVNPAVAKRVMDGEDFDVGLTNPWYVEEMIAIGRVIPDIHVPFGRVPLTIGAAVREPEEIASSHEAVSRILSNADSIAYTSTGTSGKTFLRAIEMMGLKDQLRDRLRPMGAGEPPIAAAKGDVQYAIAPLSRILAAPGIAPIANFPPELGLNIDMSMFVHKDSRREPALQLIQFLSDPEQDAYLRSHGVYRYELSR
ncbi:substrate-binding domain-containing protein [Bradyrhizobium lablabi]|uniref:substrate-binding domain-containing protein n=1 Tax=Bradyrhizobium lablabi TaxID=722472 RepID=UPI001BADA612|nr:substrate-binding domain-containing protein [Bradyrhizobium lablabi]MBR1124202.1 substrate-binding domain-containing protein [Bradyrhizobium lablabi]